MYHSVVFTISYVAVCLVFLVTFPVQADQPPVDGKTVTALKDILAGTHRAESDKVRDQYRHPLETLMWFGIKDDMTVVEIWPGGGWYTDILAPLLKEHGTYYAAGAGPESEGSKKFKEKWAAIPTLLGKVQVPVLPPPQELEVAPAGSADLVL